MMPVVLYRKVSAPADDEAELQAIAAAGLPVVFNRAAIPPDSLVICRYSCLPFYRELEKDIVQLGSRLINSFREHHFIADLSEWYSVLGPENGGPGLTPRTWSRFEEMPEKGPFVLKGETNSRKDRWSSLMFAETRADAIQVAARLREDGLLAAQTIYAREYLPLRRLATGLNGMPISQEYRFFCMGGRVLSAGFYWSSHLYQVDPKLLEVPGAAQGLVEVEVLPKLVGHTNFVVVDVGVLEDGSCRVVELNDGQMSGLSENDPATLYRAIAECAASGRATSWCDAGQKR